MNWKKQLSDLLNEWPHPNHHSDVRSTFAAMRDVLAALAERHLKDEDDRERVKKVARGDIRAATRLAVEFGVPPRLIFTPFMLLLSRHNLRG